MNTLLELRYRDAHGFSEYEDVVVKGEITAENIKLIWEGLWDGEMIIADQVGLPTPSRFKANLESSVDHVFTILIPFEDKLPEPKSLHTDQAPTIDIHIDDLAKAINSNPWDIIKEVERLGL